MKGPLRTLALVVSGLLFVLMSALCVRSFWRADALGHRGWQATDDGYFHRFQALESDGGSIILRWGKLTSMSQGAKVEGFVMHPDGQPAVWYQGGTPHNRPWSWIWFDWMPGKRVGVRVDLFTAPDWVFLLLFGILPVRRALGRGERSPEPHPVETLAPA